MPERSSSASALVKASSDWSVIPTTSRSRTGDRLSSVKSGCPLSRSMPSMSGQGRKTRSQATSARSFSAW